MKKQIWSFVAGGLIMTAAPVLADGIKVQVDRGQQQPASPQPPDAVQVQANKATPDANNSSSIRATSLIGRELQDENGKDLGKVTDIVLNLNNQSIEYVLLDAPNKSNSFVALPPTVLNARYDNNATTPQIYTSVPANQFQQAPVLSQQQWSNGVVDPNWAQQNNQFYRQFAPTPGAARRMERQINRQLD